MLQLITQIYFSLSTVYMIVNKFTFVVYVLGIKNIISAAEGVVTNPTPATQPVQQQPPQQQAPRQQLSVHVSKSTIFL